MRVELVVILRIQWTPPAAAAAAANYETAGSGCHGRRQAHSRIATAALRCRGSGCPQSIRCRRLRRGCSIAVAKQHPHPPPCEPQRTSAPQHQVPGTMSPAVHPAAEDTIDAKSTVWHMLVSTETQHACAIAQCCCARDGDTEAAAHICHAQGRHVRQVGEAHVGDLGVQGAMRQRCPSRHLLGAT